VGGSSQGVVLWDVDSGKKMGRFPEREAVAVYSLAFSPDGKLLGVCFGDGTVELRDVETWSTRWVLEGNGKGKRVWSVDFSGDGRRLVTAGGGSKYEGLGCGEWGVCEEGSDAVAGGEGGEI
jgi:WD40 repeat protein